MQTHIWSLEDDGWSERSVSGPAVGHPRGISAFREFATYLPDGVFVDAQDPPRGQQALCRLVGYDGAELIGSGPPFPYVANRYPGPVKFPSRALRGEPSSANSPSRTRGEIFVSLRVRPAISRPTAKVCDRPRDRHDGAEHDRSGASDSSEGGVRSSKILSTSSSSSTGLPVRLRQPHGAQYPDESSSEGPLTRFRRPSTSLQ